MPKTAFKTPKSRETYDRVLEAAMTLFKSQGYDKTTMREISRESGLGLGAIYYYIHSKNDIVLRFYEVINDEIIADFASQPPASPHLHDRLASLMRLKIKHLSRYRDLFRVVMKEAIDPDSPLNPMSPESSHVLATSLGQFEAVVCESGRVTGAAARQSARALWVVHTIIIGYWLYDRSDGYRATDRAIDTFALGVRWFGRASRIPGTKRLSKLLYATVDNLFPKEVRMA